MNETLNRLINDINEKKADADQIISVINTLLSLTEIGNEKAAVLLDEFRIH